MAGICDIPPISDACNVGGGVIGGAAKSAWDSVADSFGDSMASVVKTMLTFWTHLPSPDLGGGGVVARIIGYVYWLQGFVLVLSFLIVAGKLCMNLDPKPAGDALKGLCTLVLVSGAGVAGIDLLTKAGDAWSIWVIDQASGGEFGNHLAALTGGSTTLGPFGSGLEFCVALLGIFAAMAQMLLLIARIGILSILAGVLPLAASSAVGSEAGRAWFQKLLSWIFAFILYKPVAALVYATAFTLVGAGTDFTSVCAGLMLLVLAVFALPALMRLTVPLVGAATGGGGGSIAGAAAGAALASGARRVPDERGGSTSPAPNTKPGLAPGSPDSSSATGAVNAGGAKAGLAAPAMAGAAVAAQGVQTVSAGAQSAAGDT